MSNMIKEAISEARQLPAMLGKTLGGIMAVAGFGGWVYQISRGAEAEVSVGFFIAGVIGIVVFVLTGMLLKSKGATDISSLSHKERAIKSSISWLILIILSALFLLLVYLVAR